MITCILKYWELSSVGSEHLPYKQRVTGSNPVAPTDQNPSAVVEGFFVYTSCQMQFEQVVETKNQKGASPVGFDLSPPIFWIRRSVTKKLSRLVRTPPRTSLTPARWVLI